MKADILELQETLTADGCVLGGVSDSQAPTCACLSPQTSRASHHTDSIVPSQIASALYSRGFPWRISSTCVPTRYLCRTRNSSCWNSSVLPFNRSSPSCSPSVACVWLCSLSSFVFISQLLRWRYSLMCFCTNKRPVCSL